MGSPANLRLHSDALLRIDAEGRGTRRRRTLANLVDETGVGEELLGRIIDRLRAPDCSFLSIKPQRIF